MKDRLGRFAACVRAVDCAAACPFWHPGIVIFGTCQELVRGLPAWVETQWDNVWPRTEGFAFLLDETVVLASPNAFMAVAVAPWTSTGSHPDGSRFDRPGRSRLVLQRQADGRWLGGAFAHVAGQGRAAGQPRKAPRQGEVTPHRARHRPPRVRAEPRAVRLCLNVAWPRQRASCWLTQCA